MDFRDSLIKTFASAEAEKLVRKTVRYFQALKHNSLLSGDDSELKNVWDEICVQVQFENSIFWDAYVETAKQFLKGYVELLPEHIQLAIWLQTDDGFQWQLDNGDPQSRFCADSDAITDYIFSEFLLKAAGKWSNDRIERYIERAAFRD